MTKRKPIEIKKSILKTISKEGIISAKKLEKKINTNYQTIINNCEELQFFGYLKMRMESKDSKNGRDYLVIEDSGLYNKNYKSK